MHRDLKPENILLKSKVDDSDLVVADFGLATFVNIKDILFKRCGTPGFVAPEILLYKDSDPFYDVKCDIFSAGVIFYLLLVGKQPFQGKDYKQILRANKSCEIRFDLPEFSKVSPEANDLLKKMLEAKVSIRISAAEALKHPFLKVDVEKQVSQSELIDVQENLRHYDVDFVNNLKNRVQDSQEYVGSLELQNRNAAVNGKTET